MIWNPFAHLVKAKNFPFSHLVSSSLKMRFEDTFKAFYGSFIFSDSMGILDYLFIVSRPAESLIGYIYDKVDLNEGINVVLLLFPLMGLHIISLFPKAIVAGTLTLISSPIVLGIHLLMQPIKYFLNKKADQIAIKKLLPEVSLSPCTEVRVGRLRMLSAPELAKKMEDKACFSDEVILKNLREEKKKLRIHIFIEDPLAEELFIGIQHIPVLTNLLALLDPGDESTGLVGLFALDEGNLEAIRMALKVNRFGITDEALQKDALLVLENKMKELDTAKEFRVLVSESLSLQKCSFPEGVSAITFCYAGIANKKQKNMFEQESRYCNTKIVEIKSGGAHA